MGSVKSVFAANFAISFLQEFKQRPLIIDLDLHSLGDQNLILGQNPQKNIVDVSKLQGGAVDLKSLAPLYGECSGGLQLHRRAARRDHGT